MTGSFYLPTLIVLPVVGAVVVAAMKGAPVRTAKLTALAFALLEFVLAVFLWVAYRSAYTAASSTMNYGGKGLWVLCTSVLLLGLPYALAFQDEQMVQEEERQRQLMSEGASGMISAGGDQGGQTKAAL